MTRLFTCVASILFLAPLAACGGGGGDDTTTSGAGGSDTASSSVGAEATTYALDCKALSSLFLTTPTPEVNDWSGYFTCYGLDHGCSGTTCKWNKADLPSYLLDDDCATGETHSCTSGGKTVPYCSKRADTGYVKVDCSTADKIVITANGLPDHTIENYAEAQSLPPLGVGSSPRNATFTIPLKPTYKKDVMVFSGPGNTPGLMFNGVDLFNQYTGVRTVAVVNEFVDDCSGHPANGDYHYHALPVCGESKKVARLGAVGTHSGFFGLSMDGFPILGPYGYKDPKDSTSAVVRLESCYKTLSGCDVLQTSCYSFDAEAYAKGTCDLDECNGRVTAVPEALQAALGKEVYAYYFTIDEAGKAAFPYMPYCFRGNYTASGGPPGGGMGGPPGGGMKP